MRKRRRRCWGKGVIIITDEQKNSIIRFRRQGLGYADIGRKLGVSRDTVKSFCRRNDLTLSGCENNAYTTAEINPIVNHPVANSPVYCDRDCDRDCDRCRECGKPIEQQEKKKRRIFCSKACREKWWRENADKIDRKAVYTFTCAGCGRTFTAYGNRNRKYCSHGCYISDRFGGGNKFTGDDSVGNHSTERHRADIDRVDNHSTKNVRASG